MGIAAIDAVVLSIAVIVFLIIGSLSSLVIWEKAYLRGLVKAMDRADETKQLRKSRDEYQSWHAQLKVENASLKAKLKDMEERYRQNWTALGVQEGWLEDEAEEND